MAEESTHTDKVGPSCRKLRCTVLLKYYITLWRQSNVRCLSCVIKMTVVVHA